MRLNLRKLFSGIGKSSYQKKVFTLSVCFIFAAMSALYAQTNNISGKVTDENKEPLIGVSVIVTGTTTGTITDLDGHYTISANNGDVLTFSFIGMKTEQVTVQNQTTVNLQMKEDSKMLSEAVVIGYGSAQSKDLTSPITTINSETLSMHLTASPMQGLQGKVSGIQVINTGQPGSSPKVRMRGVGSYNDETAPKIAEKKGPTYDKSAPLYVVDGMFYDDISFLSNSDIESMNILKDASAAAIYGVRAANGVIIITTKKGVTNTTPQITYDGYVGFQTAANKVKMANSEQYSQLMREAGVTSYIDKSIELYGGVNGVPSTSTDWYDQLLKTAFMQSHSLNVTGGSNSVTYAVGANYLNQDGIMDIVDNGYERINTRVKLDVKVTKNFKVGANLVLSNSTQDIAPEDAWRKAFIAPPIIPVYDENNTVATPIKFASPKQLGYDEYFGNPVSIATYWNSTARMYQIMPSYYAELSLFDDKLTFRSSFSQSISNTRTTNYTPKFAVSTNQKLDRSNLEKISEHQNNFIIDNILTYRDSFNSHNLTFMLGNSVRKDRYEKLYATAKDVPNEKENWYIEQGAKDSRMSADAGQENRGASFFARAMYNYDDRYLLSATLRADGSSKYQQKWGYFPSIGLGWAISQENFMKNQNFFNYLKIRGSWGKLGNDKIEPNTGFSVLTQDLNTTGIFNDTQIVGSTNVSFYRNLSWEVVEEINAGFDFTVLDSRLSGEFDYYKRTTTNAVFNQPLPFGAGTLKTNNGKIENSGIEFTLNWNDKIGKEFAYNIGFNLTTLKNKVTYLNGLERYPTGSAEFRTYRMLGEAIDSFYGYKITGVYQNQAEIDADPVAVKNGLKPGDFKYQDTDGDGDITDADRVVLGSKLPKLYIGGNLGFDYKHFDFNVAFHGEFGHKIANQKRGLRRWQNSINFDEDMVKNRWTGEGSTNTYPSAAGYIKPWNITKFNSFFVESANAFTIQNIQLGYTLYDIIPNASKKNSIRFNLTAERPFSFFAYNGFTTDIADGFDVQTYPLASTFSFGVKITY